MQTIIEKTMIEHEQVLKLLSENDYKDVLQQIIEVTIKSFKSGNKMLVAGNGGSAADSQHLAAELIARYKLERRSLPAIALTTDTSILTAIGNDYSFDTIFERQIEGLGNKGDVFYAFSTSGNSENIKRAVIQAKKQGVLTVGFLGKDGGELKNLVDIPLVIPSMDTGRVQEMHMMSYHMICDIIEQEMFTK